MRKDGHVGRTGAAVLNAAAATRSNFEEKKEQRRGFVDRSFLRVIGLSKFFLALFAGCCCGSYLLRLLG
jgi:hypothetical protein